MKKEKKIRKIKSKENIRKRGRGEEGGNGEGRREEERRGG